MVEIPASMVKDLRDRTGAGFLDCKKALVEAGGDMAAAIDLLRKKGFSTATEKQAVGSSKKSGGQGRPWIRFGVSLLFASAFWRVVSHTGLHKSANWSDSISQILPLGLAGITTFMLIAYVRACISNFSAAHVEKKSLIMTAIFIFSLGCAAFLAEPLTRREREDQTMCRFKPICADYAAARQQCATAGSYKVCMQIKMGDDRYSQAADACNQDGTVGAPPNLVPGAMRCAWVTYVR